MHLEADLYACLDWAEANGKRWAFSLSNAGARYAEFRRLRSELPEVDWAAVAAKDFRDSEIKEGKQAEFLFHEFFPWQQIQRIGVLSDQVRLQALKALDAGHRPALAVRPDWYY